MKPPADKVSRWLALQAGLLTPIVEIWLRCTSFGTCQRQLLRLARLRLHPAPASMSLDLAQAIAAQVLRGNRDYSIYPAACLTRSLVLQYLLARRGAVTDLCLGVRNTTGRFEAHAWIEYRGCALNEDVPPREVYTPFDWTRAEGSKTA